MPRRLPPLNALRAFEAAARHLSFTRAAEELYVTQAAISHQVKALEERLGVSLFKRSGRNMVLTDAGQAYLPPLREAFDAIAAATDRITAGGDAGSLKITCLGSFAAKWLLPRLPRFRQHHPEIDVLVSPSDERLDLLREGFDVGIRYGHGRYPGHQVDRLMGDSVFPVCAPKLIDGEPPLKSPADLKNHTLLRDDATGGPDLPDWHSWLKAAGVQGVDPSRGLAYTDSSMLIQAAVEGQGVALGRSSLAEGDLASGRLVAPFDLVMPARFAYYVVIPQALAEQPKLKAFRDWILEEAAPEREHIDRETA